MLGQEKAAGKGKELETIQRLLTFLDIKGAVITIDAGGCHKVIVEQICEKGDDYLIPIPEYNIIKCTCILPRTKAWSSSATPAVAENESAGPQVKGSCN